MVDPKMVKKQLQRIGADFKFWGKPELRELPRILFEGEQLEHVINGRYTGGFATLVATSHRVLLIDKKPLYLTMEDIRYDMISDVIFNHRLLDANVNLGTMNKDINFTAYNSGKLRTLTAFIQRRVMEQRQRSQPDPIAETLTAQPGVPQGLLPQQQSQISPYKMPVMIRKRAARFY